MNLLQFLYDQSGGPVAPYCLAHHPKTGVIVRCLTEQDARDYHADGWQLLACGSPAKPRAEAAQ